MRLDTESASEDFLEEGVSSAGFGRRGTIVSQRHGIEGCCSGKGDWSQHMLRT